jgi:DNA-binding CsgD family transcriptional regulator
MLTDPASTVGCAPLADVPCLPRLPELIRLKYLTTTNRWTTLIGRAPPVGLLNPVLSASLMWREMLRDFGIADIASVVFADRYGCWGFLDLWLAGDRQPYDASAMGLLDDISMPVCAAIRRHQAATFLGAAHQSAPGSGPAVLVLNDDLAITGRTTAATQWLRSLLPTEPGAAPIPAAAYNVAAQLLAAEAGVDDHPASARAFVPGGGWVTLRASRLDRASAPDGGSIAVSIEETGAVARLDLFGRSHGLSAREQQLLRLLSRGADTQDNAEEMTITEYTVQDHLKSIFSKTSLTSRNAVLTAALGPGPTG